MGCVSQALGHRVAWRMSREAPPARLRGGLWQTCLVYGRNTQPQGCLLAPTRTAPSLALRGGPGCNAHEPLGP